MRRSVVISITACASVALTLSLTGVAQGELPVKKDSPLSGKRGAAAPEITAQAPTDVGNNSVRVAGADRYATAVEISNFEGWDETNASVVYLSSGVTFPDALSAAASAFGGPLLTTPPTELLAVTAAELDRLKPCAIIIVGGTSAVSAAVAEQADTFTRPELCEPPA